MFSAVRRAGRKIKQLPLILSHFLPSCFFFSSILFIPQAGVKGKLGRLLGVFEVSFLPKLAEQSAHVTAQRSKPLCVFVIFKHLSVSPPPSDISPAKPGPEAPDVRLRVDGDRNAGGLGGLGQHRYAAAPSPIFTDATRRARSGSSFTSAPGAVIYVQAYRLHGGGGVGGGQEAVDLGQRSWLQYVTAVSWHMRQ